jgi:hypothetical protein
MDSFIWEQFCNFYNYEIKKSNKYSFFLFNSNRQLDILPQKNQVGFFYLSFIFLTLHRYQIKKSSFFMKYIILEIKTPDKNDNKYEKEFLNLILKKLIKYVTFLENLSISYSYSLTKNQYKKCFF